MTYPKSILEDYSPEPEFAAALGVSQRTISRYRTQPDGLPFMVLGGRIFVHMPGAKAWMARRTKQRNQRRFAKGRSCE